MTSLRLTLLCSDDYEWNLGQSVRFIRTGMTVFKLKSKSKNLFANIDLSTWRMRLCIATSPEMGTSDSMRLRDLDSTNLIRCGSRLTRNGSVEI